MKRSISLILAIAVVFCFCMVPVSADDIPTATLTATLVGDVPEAGEAFTVSLDFSDISTNLIKSTEIAFSWPTDVASLYASDYGVTITDSSIASYASNIETYTFETTNALGITTSQEKFSTIELWNVDAGTGDLTIYINTASLTGDAAASVELEDGSWHFATISFILGEDQSYDDFYFDITNVIAYFTPAGTDIESNTTNGTVTTKGITTSVSAPETVTVDGVTYNVVSENLISNPDDLDTWTNAYDGGALVDWESVDVDYTASGKAMHSLSAASSGGSANTTMRTFFPIDGGKTYYVTNTYYNNTSSAQTWGAMAAIVATGAPVYGTFSGLTFYSHVNYGGYNSWSNESAPTIVGDKTSRADIQAAVGFNQIETIINAPDAAQNIMISYGAWGNSEYYFGDFAIYEVEEQAEPATEPTEEPETDEPVTEPTEEPETDEPVTEPTEEPETDEPVTEPTEEPETDIEGAYYAVAGQNEEGIYDLPEEITGKATVTFKGAVIESANNTLIGINSAELMTSSAYFTNSSVMLLINADGALSYRNGSSTVSSGVNLTIGEEYDFTYEIDVTSATWGVTIADAEGNVVFTISDLAFRTTTDVLDSIVLVNNDNVDKVAYVRDIVVTVEEEPVTEPTQEPETDEPVTEPTEEPETDEPVTDPTEEPETDEPVTEPTEEETLPEDALVAVTGQDEAGIYALDTAITTTGTVSFKLVADADQTNDTLVALTNAEAMTSNTNYYANAGVQLMLSGTTLSARIDGSAQEIGTLVSGEVYDVVVTVDVENQTWSAVVTDANGDEVAEVVDAAFRCESALASIDAIALLDNKGGVESVYVYDLTVEAETEGGDVEEGLSVEVTEYTYTDGGQVIAKVGLIDGATAPTDTIVYVVSFTKDGAPLGIVAGEIEVGGTINVSNSDSTGVAAISFVTGITVEDVSPVDGDSDLGTPVGVYYPAE